MLVVPDTNGFVGGLLNVAGNHEKIIDLATEAFDIFVQFGYAINVRIVRKSLMVKGAIANGACKDNLEGTDHNSYRYPPKAGCQGGR
jgi:hypothetical protein